MPLTMSHYYREISIAGRDKKLSVCRLYFSLQDEISLGLTKLKMSQIFYKDFELMMDFCFSRKYVNIIFYK